MPVVFFLLNCLVSFAFPSSMLFCYYFVQPRMKFFSTWLVTVKFCCKQIWDFNLGQLRGNDESNTLEVGYSANEVGFMMKSYSELLKEPSSATTRGLELSGLNCSIVNEDMAAFNVSQIAWGNMWIFYFSCCVQRVLPGNWIFKNSKALICFWLDLICSCLAFSMQGKSPRSKNLYC